MVLGLFLVQISAPGWAVVAPAIQPAVPFYDVIRIGAGTDFACAMTSKGAVRCWGENVGGQLGVEGSAPALPSQLSVAAFDAFGLGSSVRLLTVGARHACAANRPQGARCWGANDYGQLGNGTSGLTPVRAPVNVQALDVEVRTLAAGQDHTCALNVGGGVFCWGRNDSGQLGDGSNNPQNTPRLVVGMSSGNQALSAGTYHSCALTAPGGVRCWGRNDWGQLGNGGITSSNTPVNVTGLSAGVIAIAAGGDHTCAITAAREVKCWGRNTSGQLGNGDPNFDPNALPSNVAFAVETSARTLFLTESHSCALVFSGSQSKVQCWGNNANNQLLSNGGANLPVPADVVVANSGEVVDAIDGTELFTCARTANTGLKCRGYENLRGQLGRGGSAVPLATPDSVLNAYGTSSIGSAPNAKVAAAVRLECSNNTPSLSEARCDLIVHPGLQSATIRVSGDSQATSNGTNSGAMRLEMWRDTDAHTSCGTGCNSAACTTVGVDNASRVNDPNETGTYSCDIVVQGGTSRRVNLLQINSIATATFTNASAKVIAAVGKPPPLAGTIQRPPGGLGDFTPQPSADGRYYVYRSGGIIRRHDTVTGAVLSLPATNASDPSISADGTLVVLVQSDPPAKSSDGAKAAGFGVYLRNILTSTSQRLGSALTPGAAVTSKPRISPNGKTVVWTATNTDPAMGQLGQKEVFRVDLSDGVAAAKVIGPPSCVTCKSRTNTGLPAADSDGDSFNAVLSADGSRVAFETRAKNQIAAAPAPCMAPGVSEIQLRDLISGFNNRVSPPPNLPAPSCGSEGSTAPTIDFAGDTVAFTSDQPLAPNALGGVRGVFVAEQGIVSSVSQTEAGGAANAASMQAAISGDGSSVAFVSEATNLDPDLDDPTLSHMPRPHVRRLRGSTQRFSRGEMLDEANGPSTSPAMGYNGDKMYFDSTASNYVSGDNNNVSDVFQRDVYTDRILGNGFE